MMEEKLQLDAETERAWREGRVDLISQETAQEALLRGERYQQITHKYRSPQRRIEEYQHWIDYLSALGAYYFSPSLTRLRELVAAEAKRQQQPGRHHGRRCQHTRHGRGKEPRPE